MKRFFIFIAILLITNLFTFFILSKKHTQRPATQTSNLNIKNKLTNVKTEYNYQPCDSILTLKELSNYRILFCRDHIEFNSSEFFIIGAKVLEDKNSFPDLFNIDNTNYPVSDDVNVFPQSNPQFFVITAYAEAATGTREAMGIYQVVDGNPTRVYKASFGADNMKGRIQGYIFSNSEPAFIMKGGLGSIGCGGCSMEWSNFYKWDTSRHTFMLDNVSHKDYFQSLLAKYEDMDKQGCSLSPLDSNRKQDGYSWTELYNKFPSIIVYCDAGSNGIPKEKITTLLKAKKTINAILSGRNVGSDNVPNQHI